MYKIAITLTIGSVRAFKFSNDETWRCVERDEFVKEKSFVFAVFVLFVYFCVDNEERQQRKTIMPMVI